MPDKAKCRSATQFSVYSPKGARIKPIQFVHIYFVVVIVVDVDVVVVVLRNIQDA